MKQDNQRVQQQQLGRVFQVLGTAIRPLTVAPWSMLFTAFVVCSLPAVAWGVVSHDSNEAETSVAPADDPGWDNVGRRGGGSAVYLGNRWVLSAAHVRPGPVTFGDTTYQNVVDQTFLIPNPPITIENEDGEPIELTAETDLMLMRLRDEPDLPAIRLGCEPVEAGAEVLMIGTGRVQEPELSGWNVQVNPEGDDDVWTPAPVDQSDQRGYLTTDQRTRRWGRNQIEGEALYFSADWGHSLSLYTIFDEDSDLAFEAQGVRGDSGGPAFRKNGGVWELIGVIHSVDLMETQPGGTTSAVFGTTTQVADLFQYADAIREIADFEPETGDLDGDGVIGAADADVMLAAIAAGEAGCHTDLNGDSQLDTQDLDQLLQLGGALPGDVDFDGSVGFADFLRFAGNYRVDGGWADGDFSGDRHVDFTDFLVLSTNFGRTVQESPNSMANLPEPHGGACTIMLWAAVTLMARHSARRQRHRQVSATSV